MDVLEKIEKMKSDRGWTEYKLSEESCIPQSTINSWFKKKIYPTIPTLQKICAAFNITLAQFFAEDDSAVDLTGEQRELLELFNILSREQQVALLGFLNSMKQK